MGYSKKDDRLNYLYLLLWGTLDQFSPENRHLDIVEPPYPEFGQTARIIAACHELASLGGKLPSETYGDPKRRQMNLEYAYDRYNIVLSEFDKAVHSALGEVKAGGATPEDMNVATDDVNQVIELFHEHINPKADLTAWKVRAQQLKDHMGSKALEYSSRIYPRDEGWEPS